MARPPSSLFGDVEVAFGKCSASHLEAFEHDDLPFELPVGQYLMETLAAMICAPAPGKEPGEDGKHAEVSPNYKRLRKVLASEPAREVCFSLSWLAIGVIMEIVSDETVAGLREALSGAWLRLTASLGPKGRDWLLDALPAVLAQTTFRLMVDAFPQDVPLLTKHSAAIVEKLGMITQQEISGFQASPQMLRELRRRVFRENILRRPYMSLFAVRKAQMRQEKLEGHCENKGPLAFGSMEGQPLEETQMEHVFCLRREAAIAERRKGASALPPLCPEELNADRHFEAEEAGEALFMKHLRQFNPEAARLEMEAAANIASEFPEDGSGFGDSPHGSPRSPSGSSMAMSPQKRSTMARSSRVLFARRGTVGRLDPAADSKRREHLLDKRFGAPLSEAYYARRPVVTSGVSPILERLAPGAHPAGEALSVKMRPPGEQFLPRIDTPPRSPSTGGGGSRKGGSRRPPRLSPKAGLAAAMSAMALAGPTLAPMEPTRSHKGEVIESVSLQIKRETIKQRIAQELEGFKKRSFEQYRRDFDIVSGQRRTRLDGERLKNEETSTLQKHEGLLGSRSAPALRQLGPRGAGDSGSGGGGGGSRRPGAGAGAARRRPGVLTPIGGGGGGGGGRAWNELTKVEF